jgi:hypothetical protein
MKPHFCSLSLWERARVRGFGSLQTTLRRPSPLPSPARRGGKKAELDAYAAVWRLFSPRSRSGTKAEGGIERRQRSTKEQPALHTRQQR